MLRVPVCMHAIKQIRGLDTVLVVHGPYTINHTCTRKFALGMLYTNAIRRYGTHISYILVHTYIYISLAGWQLMASASSATIGPSTLASAAAVRR